MNLTYVDSSRLQYAAWRAFLVATNPNPQVAPGAFRPPGWGKEQPKTFIEDEEGNFWFFDAVIRQEHSESQRITQHPIQTNASISDHSYALPAQLTMEIGMSDVMDSYISGQWGTDSSSPTRSVMAYETLKKWKSFGVPLIISTRLDIYQNMVVQSISAPENINTLYGLKCLVTFQQIFTASIKAEKTNLRPSVGPENPKGAENVTPITGSVLSGDNLVTDAFKGVWRTVTRVKDFVVSPF